ncbi:hypothetical protein ACFL21_02345 [Patescibacteria group bacterium]
MNRSEAWEEADTDLIQRPETLKLDIKEGLIPPLKIAITTLEGLHTPGANSDALWINPFIETLDDDMRLVAAICDGVTGGELDSKHFTGKFASEFFIQTLPSILEDLRNHPVELDFSTKYFNPYEVTGLNMGRYGFSNEMNLKASKIPAHLVYDGTPIIANYWMEDPEFLDQEEIPTVYAQSPWQLTAGEDFEQLPEFMVINAIKYAVNLFQNKFFNYAQHCERGIYGSLTTLVMILELEDDYLLVNVGDSPYCFIHQMGEEREIILSPDHNDGFGAITSCIGARFFYGDCLPPGVKNLNPVMPSEISTLRISKKIAKKGVFVLSSDGMFVDFNGGKFEYFDYLKSCSHQSPANLIRNAFNHSFRTDEKLQIQHPDDKTIFTAKFE